MGSGFRATESGDARNSVGLRCSGFEQTLVGLSGWVCTETKTKPPCRGRVIRQLDARSRDLHTMPVFEYLVEYRCPTMARLLSCSFALDGSLHKVLLGRSEHAFEHPFEVQRAGIIQQRFQGQVDTFGNVHGIILRKSDRFVMSPVPTGSSKQDAINRCPQQGLSVTLCTPTAPAENLSTARKYPTSCTLNPMLLDIDCPSLATSCSRKTWCLD